MRQLEFDFDGYIADNPLLREEATTTAVLEAFGKIIACVKAETRVLNGAEAQSLRDKLFNHFK
jgi:hypothetical protein